VEVRQRTLERQQEKEARLDAFLETTRARVGKDKESGTRVVVVKAKGVAGANEEHMAVPAGENALACPPHSKKQVVTAWARAEQLSTKRRGVAWTRACPCCYHVLREARSPDQSACARGMARRLAGRAAASAQAVRKIRSWPPATLRPISATRYVCRQMLKCQGMGLLAALAALACSHALPSVLMREGTRCCAASPTGSARESRYSPIAAST
jgi:hypothetical protein